MTPLLALLWLLGMQNAQAQAGGESIRYESSGSGNISSFDRYELLPDGTLIFKTISPTGRDWSAQNRVGEFRTKVDPVTYAALANELKKALSTRQGGNPRPAPDQGEDALLLGSRKIVRLHNVKDDEFLSIAKKFMPLREAALTSPYSIAELSCVREPGRLACKLYNAGSVAFNGPNPKTALISCASAAFGPFFATTFTGTAPAGPTVEIPAHSALEFSISPIPQCSTRLLLRAQSGGFETLVSNSLDMNTQSGDPADTVAGGPK